MMSDDEKNSPFGTEDERGADRPWWSDVVKDFASAGLATLFLTEDSIRSYLREKKLPKELVSDLLDGIGRKKGDVYNSVVQEIRKILSKIDVTKEVSKFLENHHVHFEGKLSFEPKRPKT